MKITSCEANKELARLNDELNSIKTIEGSSCYFIASIQEKLEDARPVYDFDEVQANIASLTIKITELKHKINVFNTKTKLPCGLTIDEALVQLPLLNDLKRKLSRMSTKLPKERMQTYSNGVVEYKYANYDVETAKDLFSDYSLRISTIQNQLDEINNTVKGIEI